MTASLEYMETHTDFSLQDISWGYRDIFASKIEELFAHKLLGEANTHTTRIFFNTLEQAKQGFSDDILHEFLKALNPRTYWIFSFPDLFQNITELGCALGREKLFYGITFFRVFGEGGLGETPGEISDAIAFIYHLWEHDVELAVAFLRGYKTISQRLGRNEIIKYIDQGIAMSRNNRHTAVQFLQARLASAITTMEILTRECRLEDSTAGLETLIHALTGKNISIDNLGELDSDELSERGSTVVCLSRWLYLPAGMNTFASRRENYNCYLGMTLLAASSVLIDSFPEVHGRPGYNSCIAVTGRDIFIINLFQIAEYVRIVEAAWRMWPGARGLVRWIVETAVKEQPPATDAGNLLFETLAIMCGIESDSMHGIGDDSKCGIELHYHRKDRCDACELLMEKAQSSMSFEDTHALLGGAWVHQIKQAYPHLQDRLLPPPFFLPDFLYPGEITEAPPSPRAGMQITESSSRRPEKTGTEKRKAEQENSADTHPKGSEPGSEEQAPVGEHLYDEWSEFDNDYYRDYCLLREIRPRAKKSAELPADLKPQVRRVKRLFEFIKPSRVEKEKYCDEGDAINHELLVDYITQKKIEPSPKVNFYEKITINTRDIAVLVLLDVSGSTGNEVGEKRVLDLERNAALILGEGLKIVGDPFGVCGFSGQGRENCEFFVYKDFAQAWDNETIGAILEARPKTSTRMGVALRHAGSILSRRENRKKLLILITDGKAMDAEYDSSTMYAQYDVRKAVQENRDAGINCFAISTDEESQADMQLMFPGSRYCIVPKIERLPQALPALYLRLTL